VVGEGAYHTECLSCWWECARGGVAASGYGSTVLLLLRAAETSAEQRTAAVELCLF